MFNEYGNGITKALETFFIFMAGMKKRKGTWSHFSLHLMSMKTKLKALKTHFHTFEEYENGDK